MGCGIRVDGFRFAGLSASEYLVRTKVELAWQECLGFPW